MSTKKVEMKIVKVLVNGVNNPDIKNASYNLDGIDYLLPMDTMTEEVAKENEVIKLTNHPEVVEMISRGTFRHSFYINDRRVEDSEAIEVAHNNIGEYKD